MDENLMMEYHRRTDHGRDGAELDSLTCNCVSLFHEYYMNAFNDGVDWMRAFLS